MLPACVLVVERDPVSLHVVRAWLSAAGFAVLDAVCADEACDEAEAAGSEHCRIDAVVCGWDPAWAPGADAVARLGRIAASRHAPVLIISDRPYELPSWVLRRTMVKGVLARPFGMSLLVRTIEAAIGSGGEDGRIAA